MDEDRVRYPVGRTADGTTHRVGLTRHCLASGTIQLPFALRDTLPEGELLAHDVQRQESVHLVCEPPRRLHGLRELFQAHDLQVNDLLEIRLEDGVVRLATVQTGRRVSHDREVALPPRRDPSARSAPAAWRGRHGGRSAPSEEESPDDGDLSVVERFGSVTVRRLGAESARPPAGTTLPEEPDRVPEAVPEAELEEAPSAPPSAPEFDAPAEAPADRRHDEAAPAAGGRVRAGASAAGEVPDGVPRRADAPGQAPQGGVGDAPANGVIPPVRQGDLFASSPRPEEGTVSAAPQAAGARRPDAPHVAHGSAVPAPPVSSAPTPPEPTPPASAPPASAQSVADDTSVRPSDLAEPNDDVKRRREESLSRAGDLRSRVVRWLLDPETPVIVQHQHVQHAFDLPYEVARDLLAGVIEEPPPSLRLTQLREGIFRVSRITVEHEA